MANEVKFNIKFLIDGKEHVVEATTDVKELAKELEGAKTGFSTKETWFYRMDMPEGYKHFSKTKPMKRSIRKRLKGFGRTDTSDWQNKNCDT